MPGPFYNWLRLTQSVKQEAEKEGGCDKELPSIVCLHDSACVCLCVYMTQVDTYVNMENDMSARVVV